MDPYLTNDRITIGHDTHHTKTLLLADWWASYVAGEDAVMLAGRRADVTELNLAGHLRADTAGMLTGPTLDVRGIPIQAGDKVVMLRNDRRLDVKNANRGVVLAVDAEQHTMQVQLARKVVDVPARYVDAGHVGLAYAMTVHKAHGTTCDATMMLADDLLYRELAYEALSRGRKTNRIYMSRQTMAALELQLEDGPHAKTADIADDPLDVLAAGLERRRNKQLALDHITSTPLTTWATGDLVTERRRIAAVLDDAPPDRTADLSALCKRRDELAAAIERVREDVTRLENRKRPRRERKHLDPDLMVRRQHLAGFEYQAGEVDRSIASIHASQHRLESHIAAHHASRIALGEIEHVLTGRLREQVNRSLQAPPHYIVKTLGQRRPDDRRLDKAWVRSVVAVEQYRFNHGITNARTLIGPPPDDPEQRRAWRAAADTIEDTRHALSPERPSRPTPELPTRLPTPHPHIEPPRPLGPELGLGL